MPRNAATDALYTYTPWVGATATEFCGDLDVGGTSLIADIYRDFRGEIRAVGGGGGGGGTCELGDGLYCRGDRLERCRAGEFTLVRECENGYFVAPPGQDDRCN